MQFMKPSLDSLVKNLSDHDSVCVYEEFRGKFYKLVRQKGVYPYEYIDSFEKFFEDKLPNKCAFFSSLKDRSISEKDYFKAINVWNVFKMNTMGDYHDLYLKADVLLLADVFEKFIKICFNYYGLDPCHYFSSSKFSWNAMLKMTGIKLDLISDIDMHLFIEKAMRGGISKRYSKANNKYLRCYDSIKESKFIMYLDANNLYGWEMSQYLPYSEFKWLNKKESSRICLNSISVNSFVGYILEVDLEYPDELHNLHNDYSLAPEKLEITQNMLSKYCSDIANKYEKKKIGGVNKLVPNLRNKKNTLFIKEIFSCIYH